MINPACLASVKIKAVIYYPLEKGMLNVVWCHYLITKKLIYSLFVLIWLKIILICFSTILIYFEIILIYFEFILIRRRHSSFY